MESETSIKVLKLQAKNWVYVQILKVFLSWNSLKLLSLAPYSGSWSRNGTVISPMWVSYSQRHTLGPSLSVSASGKYLNKNIVLLLSSESGPQPLLLDTPDRSCFHGWYSSMNKSRALQPAECTRCSVGVVPSWCASSHCITFSPAGSRFSTWYSSSSSVLLGIL